METNMKKIKVFTNNDLDGAGSLMLIKWAFGSTCIIDHSISNLFKIKQDYNNFINSIDCEEYSKIFILNMVPDFELDENTLVFSKGEESDLSVNGKIDISTTTSKLLRIFFRKTLATLTLSQDRLINTINTFYIDGAVKRESMKLNAIFSYGRNKYSQFHTRFDHGLDEYTKDELTIIKNYSDTLVKTYQALELYEHNTNKGIYIGLIPDMLYKHEILDKLFSKHSPKIVFLADLSSGFISVRKNDSLQMDMHDLCDTLLVGRALVNCAGGRYTEKFLDFSRSFM